MKRILTLGLVETPSTLMSGTNPPGLAKNWTGKPIGGPGTLAEAAGVTVINGAFALPLALPPPPPPPELQFITSTVLVAVRVSPSVTAV